MPQILSSSLDVAAPRALIACEYSGVVRDAFTRRGFYAMSCDLLPTESPGPHYQGDVLDLLDAHDGIGKPRFDLMVAHPPCTYLSVSGIHWNNRGRGWENTNAALGFVRLLMAAPVKHICIENPVGILSTRVRKPDQIIQPWQFGHDASKATCLWLKGLPKLHGTKNVCRPAWRVCDMCEDYYCDRHEMHTADCECPGLEEWAEAGDDPYRKRYANQTTSGQNKLAPSEDRWKLRSTTYAGIAEAMADQWSNHIKRFMEGTL